MNRSRSLLVALLLSSTLQSLFAQLIVRNSSQVELLRITQDGMVGIGTTAPQSLLHVTGNALVNQGSLIVQKSTAEVFKCRQTQDDATTLFTVSSNGNVAFGMDIPAPPGTSYLTVKGLSSAGGTNLVVDSYGNVFKATSSERYKENIEAFTAEFDRILQLQPIRYNYTGSQQREIGYTAEALHRLGLSELVYYDDVGKPESIHYDKIVVYLLEIVKHQQQEIAELKKAMKNQ